MAEGTANPLIMALRANTAPSGSMPTGVKNISFPWQTNNTGPLVIPNRPIKPKVTTPTPPPPATTQAVKPPAPKTAEDFINGNFRYQDLPGYGGDNWDRMTGNNPNPTALVLNANKDRVQYVDTANPVLNLAQKNPQQLPISPVATIGMDEMGDKFGLNVGDFSNLPVGDVPNPYTNSMPYEFDFGDLNGGVPSDGVQVVPTPAAPAPVAANTPVTDEMSVRQTLEQILADQAPQPIESPTQVAPPQDTNIPAFNSNIDFQMPETLFRTPAPFVPGFTPQADVAQSMAPIVQEPEPLDPNLLAMLGIQPAPATQPVPEEPMYGAQVPAWYFNEFGFDGNR